MKGIRHLSQLLKRTSIYRPVRTAGVYTQAQLIKAPSSPGQAAIIEFENDQKPGESLAGYYKRSEYNISNAINGITKDLGENGGVLLAAIETTFVSIDAKAGTYKPNDTTHCFAAIADLSLERLFDPETIVDFYPDAAKIRKKGDSVLANMTLKEQEYSAPGKHGKNPARIQRLLSDPAKSKQTTGARLVGIFLPYSLLKMDTEEIKRRVAIQSEQQTVYDRMRSSCAHAVANLASDESSQRSGLLPMRAVVDAALSLCNCEEVADLIRDVMGTYLSSNSATSGVNEQGSYRP